MIRKNEELSIKNSNKNIIYLEPKLKKYGSSDFDKLKEIIEI
jgi:hypothetical protein